MTYRSSEVKKYWARNRLEFIIDDQLISKVHVLSKSPENHDEFTSAVDKGETVAMNLKDTDLLILTNSRMCQVNKIGSTYYPLFRKAVQKDTKGLFPKWLNDRRTQVATDYLPPVKEKDAKKSIDLLAYLKTLDMKNGVLANREKTCESVGGLKSAGRGRKKDNPLIQKALFKRVSVNTYPVHIPNDQHVSNAYKMFTLSTNKCHWFRLWITQLPIDQYKTGMKLSETVDFFLNEGFYVSPQSDVAYPLPGVSELTKFKFTVSREPSNENYVDMVFGEMQGNPIYQDQFKLPVTESTSFNIHVIKAPGCDIEMDTRTLLWNDYNAAVPTNMWEIGKCTFNFFDE